MDLRAVQAAEMDDMHSRGMTQLVSIRLSMCMRLIQVQMG